MKIKPLHLFKKQTNTTTNTNTTNTANKNNNINNNNNNINNNNNNDNNNNNNTNNTTTTTRPSTKRFCFLKRSAGTLLSRVRAPPPAPCFDGGPGSLRSPCYELAVSKKEN
ncbi:hypothetical protein PoB_000438500 [Plakobranchus ocellatus]|uniref:Uncharacterized protein n=1 Tax=Plakobranchus ocellatus TaxID=259542 RepID=A0AAV3Y508_9GAST|nr:hypothetical protein PoB_000438500 [Plakobranchus ocellatus]